MRSNANNRNEMSCWQLIFSQSKVNGASYSDDELPFYHWNWPTDTYLQRRRSFHELSWPHQTPSNERNDEARN